MSTTETAKTKKLVPTAKTKEEAIQDAQVMEGMEGMEGMEEPPKMKPIHVIKLQEQQKVDSELKDLNHGIFGLEKQIQNLTAQKDELVSKRDAVYDKLIENSNNLNKEIYETYGGAIEILSEEGHYRVTQPAQQG